jgi:hypothetical protein
VTDGEYELSLGEQKVLAKRQPDLYFVIALDGKQHKGYLKDLKSTFATWVSGEEPPAPSVARRGASTTAEEPRGLTTEQWSQRRIDAAENTEEAVLAWVSAYNCETVALTMGKEKRHEYLLPKGARIDPPLKECYHPRRDQYIWPRRYEEGM